jgi:hypothetical protein
MATGNRTDRRVDDPGVLRDEWLNLLTDLTSKVKSWAEELDWFTCRIVKKMEDSRLGLYEAPGLLMQKETTRVILDPVTRFAPGVDGVVDLYLMPAYDDIASLYFFDGEWRLHYTFPGTPSFATIRQTDSCPLSKDSIGMVLNEMSTHAASAF